jgi:predicted DNA-binding transcriptional regulator YafY
MARTRCGAAREVATTEKRHTEIIRQWNILRAIDSAANVTVNSLADRHGVSTRTIRRDLDALQAAGFPLYDVPSEEGPRYWRLSSSPLSRLGGTSFTVAELCAFYANRARLEASGGTPIDADLRSAIDKVGRALSPHMKAYLDKLCAVLTCKPDPPPIAGSSAGTQAAVVETLTRATVERRRVEMDYHSFASRRVKRYTIEPHRLTFTNGGLYLYAFVPMYQQMRTFALQRIRRLKVLEEVFTPGEVPEEPYANSLGPFSGGRPRTVAILFLPQVAPYVEERVWHPTQQVARHDDGSITLTMRVAIDPPLKCWVLGFGHAARVLEPRSLAAEVLEEIEEAREQYVPPIPFEPPATARREMPSLPFGGASSPGAPGRTPGAGRRAAAG